MLSPDGSVAAIYKEDGTITLLRLPDGQPLRTIKERPWTVRTLHGSKQAFSPFVGGFNFSPDSRFLLVVSNATGKIHIWRVTDGRKVAELPIPQNLLAAALSPNARLLATYDFVKCSVTVWEVATMRRLRQWHVGTCIDKLGFSPDGKQILASGNVWGPFCKLILISIADGKLMDLNLDYGFLQSATFSSTEPFIAAGIHKNWDLLARLRPKVVERIFKQYLGTIGPAFWVHRNTLSLWNYTTQQRWDLSLKQRDDPSSVAFSPDRQYLAVITLSGEVILLRRRVK